jgi:hypothetical protein
LESRLAEDKGTDSVEGGLWDSDRTAAGLSVGVLDVNAWRDREWSWTVCKTPNLSARSRRPCTGMDRLRLRMRVLLVAEIEPCLGNSSVSSVWLKDPSWNDDIVVLACVSVLAGP